MTLSVQSARRVHVLYEVAKRNGSLISLQEILPLLPEHVSEQELADAIMRAPSLSSRFELKSGFVIERAGRGNGPEVSSERVSRMKAETNMHFAKRFVPRLRSKSMKLAAVSGSTSYRSASKSEDLDMFCVTASGRLWVFLTKSLLLSRAFRLTNSNSPPICLSCVLDEGFARSMFTEAQNPLFARDALETVVLEGEDVYHDLLSRARWIRKFYPALYTRRLSGSGVVFTPEPESSHSFAFLNRFLFLVVGSYIGVKSWLLNRRLAKSGRRGDCFRLRKGVDHLIYESGRYLELRQVYGSQNAASPAVQIQ